jgi:hypothetical protein
MCSPSIRQLVCKVIHMLHQEQAQAGGERVFPVVIRDPQGALEVDAADRFFVNLWKAKG